MRNLIRQILREEQEVKKGDKLMSTKTVKNSRTAGKVYTVVGVQNNPHGEDEILFVNDRGVLLHFPISEYKDSFVPFDYDNTSDIFNNLNESDEFDWAQPETNLEGIEVGSLFLVNRIDPDNGRYHIDYDLLVRFNDVVDIHKTEDGSIDTNITISTFNYHKNKKWILNDGKIELSWARDLIDTGYYIPITKKEADELFKDFSKYQESW
jgi:hypothetical protein